MTRAWIAIAGLAGLLCVAAGAAAAHLAADSRAAALLRTGAVYGMIHAAALIGVVALSERRARTGLALAIAGCGFAGGIVLFSFSLFALALTGIGWLGHVAPFGGGCLMLGWAALALAAWRRP